MEGISTEQYAAKIKVRPHTVRRGYCVNGHYLGIKPIKLPNNRLLWPADEVEDILRGDYRKMK